MNFQTPHLVGLLNTHLSFRTGPVPEAGTPDTREKR